jgi:hypothetical protein
MAEAAGLNPVQRGFDPRRGYIQSTRMDPRFEEEPDEPEEPQPDGAAHAASGFLPTVEPPTREWEWSTKVLTVAQVSDGVTLVKLLTEAGAEGWELSDVIDGGEKRVILLRRSKRTARESRRVGFAPPAHN